MAAPSLDRNRPHGTVFGDPEGRMYQQGEHYFRGDGSLWTQQASPDPAAEAPVLAKGGKKKGAAEPAPAAVDEQIDAQMGAA